MPITTPPVTVDSLPNINTQGFDVQALAQILNAELATQVAPTSTENTTSQVTDFNTTKEPLTTEQMQALENLAASSGQELDIQRLQEIELAFSMIDSSGSQNMTPYELYAIIIMLGIMF